MFSKNTATTKVNPNTLALRNFLDNSDEFKKIKELSEIPDMSNALNFISKLERCEELIDILYLTNDFNFETTDNVVMYNLGRNLTNTMLFTYGFFSDKANLGYYVLHLRENVIEHLSNQLGSNFDPSSYSHFIPKNFAPGGQNI